MHLCTASQLLATAQRWFSEFEELGVLVFEVGDLNPELRWEDLYQRGESFPHLYGPLPFGRLQGLLRMQRQGESFEWPRGLNGFVSPLNEPLEAGSAVIEPSSRFPEKQLPARCILCFFEEVFEGLSSDALLERPGSAVGPQAIYWVGPETVACYPGVGGPRAAAVMEELIALGCQRFVLCGGAGALADQPVGSVVLVSAALRDEGTSSHYLQPSALVATQGLALRRCRRRLQELGIEYQEGLSWTTDALYRETPGRMQLRRRQECLTVEMELAALLAVAQFRGVSLVPLLYCGDRLDASGWDFRAWTSATSVREKLFWLARELVSVL